MIYKRNSHFNQLNCMRCRLSICPIPFRYRSLKQSLQPLLFAVSFFACLAVISFAFLAVRYAEVVILLCLLTSCLSLVYIVLVLDDAFVAFKALLVPLRYGWKCVNLWDLEMGNKKNYDGTRSSNKL